MIWTISLFIVAIIIFYFLRDRDKMLNAQVDGHGGIKEKYSELIEWLLSDPNAKLVKVQRDHIQISNVMNSTSTHFFITENFNKVDIEWKAVLGAMGNHKKQWSFTQYTTNEDIILKVSTDIQKYSDFII